MGRCHASRLLVSLLFAAGAAGCVTDLEAENEEVTFFDAGIFPVDARRVDSTAGSRDARSAVDARAAAADRAGQAPTCSDQGTCPTGAVCCLASMPCAGNCMPDCRIAGNSCPSFAPTCQQATGLCVQASDGGIPPPSDGGPRGDGPMIDQACGANGECAMGAVCCPQQLPCANKCVPDCRVSTEACPAQAPACDQEIGLCVPGNAVVPGADAGARATDARVLVPDAAAAPTCGSGPCPPGAVCCPPGLPCAGSCIPDCRVTGVCPPQAPTCDSASGVCYP